MIVAGGTYIEQCNWPDQTLLMGPGTRAALALSELSRGSELYTYCHSTRIGDLTATMSSNGIVAHVRQAHDQIVFFYPHALTSPKLEPANVAKALDEPWDIRGKTVLAFGLLEAKVRVSADKAVFEMSGGIDNIIRGEIQSLALIAGENDLPDDFVLGANDRDQAAEIMAAWRANLMIVRRQVGGAVLFHGDDRVDVPAMLRASGSKLGLATYFAPPSLTIGVS